jgi:hypothetical protein
MSFFLSRRQLKDVRIVTCPIPEVSRRSESKETSRDLSFLDCGAQNERTRKQDAVIGMVDEGRNFAMSVQK